MSGSGCQVAAMIDRHTESWILWLGEGEKTGERERSLITLFQGREVLPCLSLYMLELRSRKHTHVREECSLLLSFGPGSSYFNKKSSKKPHTDFLKLHSKNQYLCQGRYVFTLRSFNRILTKLGESRSFQNYFLTLQDRMSLDIQR